VTALQEIVDGARVVNLGADARTVGISERLVLANITEFTLVFFIAATFDLLDTASILLARLSMLVASGSGEPALVKLADSVRLAIVAVPERPLHGLVAVYALLTSVTGVWCGTEALARGLVDLCTGPRVAFMLEEGRALTLDAVAGLEARLEINKLRLARERVAGRAAQSVT
jgi:hypothetical protein